MHGTSIVEKVNGLHAQRKRLVIDSMDIDGLAQEIILTDQHEQRLDVGTRS